MVRRFFKCLLGLMLFNMLVTSNVEAMTTPYNMAKKHQSQAMQQYQPESALTVSQTGQILYDYRSEKSLYPASLSKLMTFYLVYDALEKGEIHLTDKVKITKNQQGVAQLPNVSTYPIQSGQVFTVEELLKQSIMVSSNAASMVLAEHVAGDTSTFTKQMNQKAKMLKMNHTYFTNPTGLDNAWLKQYAPKAFRNEGKTMTTAQDMGILATHLVNDHPQILNITSIRQDMQKAGILHTTNYSLPGETNGMKGVEGLKTGTGDQGYHFVLTAKQQQLRLQTAVLRVTPANNIHAKHARHIMANGITEEIFNQYTYKKVLSRGEQRINGKKYEVKKDLYDVVPKTMSASDYHFKVDEEKERVTLKYKRHFISGYHAPSVAVERKSLLNLVQSNMTVIAIGLISTATLLGGVAWLAYKKAS
ncbi:DUF1958 domain-containing protein [Staphylococcus sp. 17KM0847]|uniref:DUF1958 domain-containing protein n=1 Tax=Staphylococcus sp. 17KM0847 TaxID=2583989 RepID=UPI0015DF11A0|nr:DUF1958 domain-containing protein [Staphylococcus sp. 17KM0847]